MAYSVKITKARYGKNTTVYLVQPNTGMDFEFAYTQSKTSPFKLLSIYDSDRDIEISGKALGNEINGRYKIAYKRSLEALKEYVGIPVHAPAPRPVRASSPPMTVERYILKTPKSVEYYRTLHDARACARKLYDRGERNIEVYREGSGRIELVGRYTIEKNLGLIKRF